MKSPLETYIQKVNSWKYRLITTRKRASHVCKETGMWPSKVSIMLNAKPEEMGRFRFCEYAAIEGAILKFEKEHYDRLREE